MLCVFRIHMETSSHCFIVLICMLYVWVMSLWWGNIDGCPSTHRGVLYLSNTVTNVIKCVLYFLRYGGWNSWSQDNVFVCSFVRVLMWVNCHVTCCELFSSRGLQSLIFMLGVTERQVDDSTSLRSQPTLGWAGDASSSVCDCQEKYCLQRDDWYQIELYVIAGGVNNCQLWCQWLLVTGCHDELTDCRWNLMTVGEVELKLFEYGLHVNWDWIIFSTLTLGRVYCE